MLLISTPQSDPIVQLSRPEDSGYDAATPITPIAPIIANSERYVWRKIAVMIFPTIQARNTPIEPPIVAT